MTTMLRFLLQPIPVLLFVLSSSAQVPDSAVSEKKEKVYVLIKNYKGKSLKAETVVFRSLNDGKIYTGKSDAKGEFVILLPEGSQYMISIRSIVDTSKYGMLNLPRLEPGEFYTDPVTVNIKYDPAKSYTLDNVHFDFGKATLRPESYKELNELVDYLQDHPDLRIEIAGHTDNIGDESANLKLSQERAAAIKAYLVRKKIPASTVIAKGYGETVPVADNETEEGRQLNRRTEVRVL
jgi:OmpA-OmpF porin, OOP family